MKKYIWWLVYSLVYFLFFVVSCQTRPIAPYISDESPFQKRWTPEQKEEYKLYIMRELWVQKQLRDYEENRFDPNRTEP